MGDMKMDKKIEKFIELLKEYRETVANTRSALTGKTMEEYKSCLKAEVEQEQVLQQLYVDALKEKDGVE